jgi:hypothetical protein
MGTPKQGYRTADGVKVPSVTTILGRFKDSGGLIKWAYKQGREHENLAMRGLPAPVHLYDVTAKAASAGTIAHDMIEQHVLTAGTPAFAVSDVVAAARSAGTAEDIITRAENSYQQFLRWLENTRITITHTERGQVSEKYRYGGTLDAIGTDAFGRIVLVDWKTSNAIYGDYLIQLAAYALLLEECALELAPTGGFHLLRVAKESADFAHHFYGELEDQKRAFILMRELYDICAATEKRA